MDWILPANGHDANRFYLWSVANRRYRLASKELAGQMKRSEYVYTLLITCECRVRRLAGPDPLLYFNRLFQPHMIVRPPNVNNPLFHLFFFVCHTAFYQ